MLLGYPCLKRIFCAIFLVLEMQGCPMPRKNLAKMAAALLTCEWLHQIGELDDNLFPVTTLSDEESEEEEEEDESATRGRRGKAGTKKRWRVYHRMVSHTAVDNINSSIVA